MSYEDEKQEAIEAGKRALYSLREARGQLGDARGFGIWDLLGGRSFVSLFKQIKIARAKESLERARYNLQIFSRELRDINVDLSINIGEFLVVFDMFDSFFADVLVQSRIVEASRRIDEAIRAVEGILYNIQK